MKFTDQIRSTADLDSRSGEPCGRALRKSADMIDELEAALRGLVVFIDKTGFTTHFLAQSRATLAKLEKLNRE